jgi:hypothetical protein
MMGAPTSPSSDRSSLAQKRVRQHWLGSTGTPPSPCASMPSPPPIQILDFFGYISNKSQKDLDDLMGEPPGFFSTHACNVYSLIGLIGLILTKLE